ncbi:EAL domain-containing protein [Planktotalea sp.]|uniref:EAL domain-containing protein n=1 Tax=Planktotalea sp. TaxID=2029877 RepID=UPI003298BA7C
MDMVRAALEHKQVMLAYQPIMQAAGSVAFYEGLIRVLDETGRIIPAREFINVIEETEMGRIVDCLALEKGLQALRKHPHLRLSINMSARSIGYARWKKVLDRNLRTDPTLGERLILEITESSAMLVPELVISFMNDLQSRGVCFALDDFGAGYTSFRYLRDFYFDMIKIDGQFIRGISGNPDNQVLLKALVSIARHFDMFTVAEFVENEQDAQFLAQNGIDCLQGYYFGAPTVRPPWSENPDQIRASA